MFFSPSTSIVNLCAGNNFTLTCVSDTGTLVWNRDGELTITYSSSTHNVPGPLGYSITVYPANVFGSVITSVAIIDGASLSLNGTVIQCRDSGNSLPAYKEKTLVRRILYHSRMQMPHLKSLALNSLLSVLHQHLLNGRYQYSMIG